MNETELKAISRNESILGLGRITELLHLMGDPQEGQRMIHVAGTNGKGSFTAMLSSILMHSGYYVGAFNSPALLGSADSFRIDTDRLKSNMLGELDRIYADIAPLASGMSDKPTEFEVLTAAAFELFKRENCDISIIECGLGGDGDSTNVISSPVLSVITNVALDHTDRLGKTVAEIASHKAGIIKKGRPVLFGGTDADALAVIKGRAEETGSKLTVTDRTRLRVVDWSLDGTVIEFSGFGRLKLGLLGAYQPENAANVLTAVELLREEGLNIPDDAVRLGLADAGYDWPARFEIVRRNPTVIYDGAHNPDGVRMAAESIRKLFKKKKPALLMGVMADKDYKQYPGILGGLVSKVFTVRPDNPRSLDAEALAECFNSEGFITKPCSSMANAVRAALSYSEKNGVPLIVMGTLYMYREFREELGRIG